MDEKTFRAFIAIDLPDEVKNEIHALINLLKKKDKTTHWTSIEKLHVTLKFLGNITQTQSDEIIKQLKLVVQKHEIFQIEFSKLLLLPSKLSPNVIALAATPITPLVSLVLDIDHALLSTGIELEQRPFKPHLTIGKIKTKKFVEPKLKDEFHIKFKATEIKLYESELNQHGAIYTLIQSFALRH